MNAPDPTFTSKTIPSAPSAIFFESILAVIKGIDSTVAVASLREYIFLSAGQIEALCPIIE